MKLNVEHLVKLVRNVNEKDKPHHELAEIGVVVDRAVVADELVEDTWAEFDALAVWDAWDADLVELAALAVDLVDWD